ncbi:hypothetical protein [Vibrio metoecus]|uniref:hypothetical protein n=1 Tax=Vibrio metoecus TaxID=1481663 RepID=UPI0006D81EFB|nr:hypothetical protein [Vibrio metoecus]
MNISLTLKKYFHSQHELLDMRNKDERDINTLSTYLTQLHSIADKLRNNFDINLSKYPEFRVLRVMRNYMHHVDDVEETRVYVTLQPEVSLYHTEHVIVPISFWAKCLKNLIETNTRPEGHPQYASKKKFLDKELAGITDICDCFEVIESLDAFCKPARLKCDGVIIELGFDIYKFVYNMSNIIVHEFSEHTDLAFILDEVDIDGTYSIDNNIPKYDLFSRPGINCILTTQGYIFPTRIEPAI